MSSGRRPIRKLLIANRGEIAVRIARTCREMGIRTVAVCSTVDRDGAAARYADESVVIGPPAPRRSYLYVPSLVEAALRHGVDAIHPGYGFLSEDPDMARVCAENGIGFIGPPPDVMETLGDKAVVRSLMARAGLPVLAGSDGVVATVDDAVRVAARIGYPVVMKAAAGGGGRGIEVVREAAELRAVHRRVTALARSVFGDPSIYLERYVDPARHVEVQLLCDAEGQAVHLGERDCSLQRRKQKLIEEGPAPGLGPQQRAELGRMAVEGARALGYVGAATMEFLLHADGYVTFMEINGRIQVEHPVTEELTGVDLVREQIGIASGQPLRLTQDAVAPRGAVIECRVNAEDPERGFRPTPGRLDRFRFPGGPGVRVDSGYAEGDVVPSAYDSLLAKLVTWAPTREQAIARADRALAEFAIGGDGICTTVPLLRRLLAHPAFVAGTHATRTVDDLVAGHVAMAV